LGILFNFGLMLSLGWHNWARLAIWLLVGLVIYFTYSRHHSKLLATPSAPARRPQHRSAKR
jgi:basic amino acid/polyamine antiporter, APA family